jgi:histidine triad (HIT) family protein
VLPSVCYGRSGEAPPRIVSTLLKSGKQLGEASMKSDTECIFCKIVLGESPCFKLLEDENTLAIMDIFPANDGHCLVLTKEHYPTLFDVTAEAFAAVSGSVYRVARAVNEVLSPVGLNLVQANGPGAHQTVDHFHVHVLPRKLGDQLLLNWAATPGDHATIAAVAEKIRATLAGTS